MSGRESRDSAENKARESLGESFDRRQWLQASALAALALTGPKFVSPAVAASSPRVTTEVRLHRGKPSFWLQGTPYGKPTFETYKPLQRYFDQFASAGCDVFSFSASFGLYAYSRPMWTGPETWDFDEFDERVERVLQANPQGWVMPRIYLGAPAWWLEQNPGEVQILHDGSTVYPTSVATPAPKNQPFPSIASPRWREEAAAGLEQLIRHAESAGYAERLFGYMVTGLFTEEWYHWSSGAHLLADYSSHMVRAFQRWLMAKYGDLTELRRAWRKDALTLDQATIPPQSARVGRPGRIFRDPSREMNVIDFYLFYNEIIPETIDYFLGVAKRASEGRRAVGTFYGYQFEFNGNPEFGHNALGRLLDSPHLDFMMVTSSYADRQLGGGADYMRSPMTSVALRGKLWYHDNDTVGHLFYERHPRPPSEQVLAEGRRLGATATLQETIWKHRRAAGFVLGHGVYQSFFDLHGGYFDAPEVMAEIERLNRLLHASMDEDRASRAEILVVTDEASCAYAEFNSLLLEQSLRFPQPALAKIGAPHDSILLEDLARVDLHRYRLVILLNAYLVTEAQRALLADRVLADGRTVLWCGAPGLFSDDGERRESLASVVGIDVRVAFSGQPTSSWMELVQGDDPLCTALRQAGVHAMGHGTTCFPPVQLRDEGATIAARLAEGGGPALIVKELPRCRSIYCLTPALPPRFFRAVARIAGVHIYVDSDDAFYASESYLALSADGDRVREIRFPAPCDVWDPFSGVQLASKSTVFRHSLQDKETVIFRLAQQR